MTKLLTFTLLLISLTSIQAEQWDQEQFDQGKAVYDKVCVACHNYMPPPKNAPPMIGISGHYHQAFSDKNQAMNHIQKYLAQPSAEQSKLPPMAVNAWGLMPPQALSESEAQAVAYWIWHIYTRECQEGSLPFCRHFQN